MSRWIPCLSGIVVALSACGVQGSAAKFLPLKVVQSVTVSPCEAPSPDEAQPVSAPDAGSTLDAGVDGKPSSVLTEVRVPHDAETQVTGVELDDGGSVIALAGNVPERWVVINEDGSVRAVRRSSGRELFQCHQSDGTPCIIELSPGRATLLSAVDLAEICELPVPARRWALDPVFGFAGADGVGYVVSRRGAIWKVDVDGRSIAFVGELPGDYVHGGMWCGVNERIALLRSPNVFELVDGRGGEPSTSVRRSLPVSQVGFGLVGASGEVWAPADGEDNCAALVMRGADGPISRIDISEPGPERRVVRLVRDRTGANVVLGAWRHSRQRERFDLVLQQWMRGPVSWTLVSGQSFDLPGYVSGIQMHGRSRSIVLTGRSTYLWRIPR